MAFAAIIVGIPLALLGSVLWAILIGGTFLQLLLVYAVSGQIGFVLALLVFLLARHLHHPDRPAAAGDLQNLSFDKLA